MNPPYLALLLDIHCALETQSMQIPVDDPNLFWFRELTDTVAVVINTIADAATE